MRLVVAFVLAFAAGRALAADDEPAPLAPTTGGEPRPAPPPAPPPPAPVQARRLGPGECQNLFRPSVRWASSLGGFSRQYNDGTWSARQALGPPNVFPNHGDLVNTWATPASGEDWIELMFPGAAITSEIWVLETYGVGGVHGVFTLDSRGAREQVWSSAPQRGRGAAALLAIPVSPPRPVAGVRIETSATAAGGYVEIDAVAAVGADAACLRPGPAVESVRASGPSWRRLSPAEYGPPAGIEWASGIRSLSSQYGVDSWSARQVLGPPNVFPQHGDIAQAWAPKSTSSPRDELVVQFPRTRARQILVFETNKVGGLFQIYDASEGSQPLLWSSTASEVSPSEARVLRVDLGEARTISALRLVVSPAAVQGWPEIDAVALVP